MTMQYLVPDNEDRRLSALYSHHILDTPEEVDFDALTRIAAHAFNTPAAVIGLMDAERLWFKSRFGLDVPQLDRQIAFCAHAIMCPDEVLVVEDLSLDARFRDNPLVTQPPHLRFYAGAPLVDDKGYVLGTIAVADNVPRSFGEAPRAVLQDIAKLVMSTIESRNRAILLSRMAMTDHLTALPNRAQFDRSLEAEMAHSTRSGEPFAVLYLDLDGFKGINDQFGHAAGDEVLCEVARRLAAEVRAEDVLTRFGGDEFGVVMRLGVNDSPLTLAKRINDSISVPIVLSRGDIVSIGVSIGIAINSDASGSLADLLSKADRELYVAKRQKAGA